MKGEQLVLPYFCLVVIHVVSSLDEGTISPFDPVECCERGKLSALVSKTLESADVCILQDTEEDESLEQSCFSVYYQCCRSQQRSMACQKGREAPWLPENSKKSCFRLFKGLPMANAMQECCICCKMALSGRHGAVDVNDVLCQESMKYCLAVKHGTIPPSTAMIHPPSTKRMYNTMSPASSVTGTDSSQHAEKNPTRAAPEVRSSNNPASISFTSDSPLPRSTSGPVTITRDPFNKVTIDVDQVTTNDDTLNATESGAMNSTEDETGETGDALNITGVGYSSNETRFDTPRMSLDVTRTASTTLSSQPSTLQGAQASALITSTMSPQESTVAPIVCPDDSFEWNPQKLICERVITSCPKGFIMDKKLRQCRIPSGPMKECLKGYHLNSESWKCEDINECLEIPSPCRIEQTVCTNTPGSYQCSCEKGYQWSIEGKCEDIDECTVLHPSPCAMGKDCFNTRGSFECRRTMPCGFGYSLDMETQECEDIDECKSDTNVCGPGMQCVNVRGGHKCEEVKCPPGLWRNSAGKCSLCKEGYSYNNRTHLCEDINECELPHMGRLCRPFENCVNRPGAYDCILKLICRRGTRLSPNGTHCEDIDECQERYFECAEDEICVNEFGSYSCKSSPCLPSQIFDYTYKQCTCKTGFRLNEYEGCQDINECEENPCGEDKQCINLIGSYSCYAKNACPQGMYRPNSHSACVDLDECTNGEARCPVNMECVNTIGSYTCTCRRGYKKEKDECVDIDDCRVYQKEVTCPDPESKCVNTIGSYICSCPTGYVWQEHPVRKCVDLDECEKDQGVCGQGHKCINLIGSYRCQCARGYAIASNGKSCKDVDECSLRPRGRPTCPNGKCFNFPGGYQCQCPVGYRLGSGNRCEDIDECRESLDACAVSPYNRQRKSCINLKGSHKCAVNTCPPGYAKSYLGNGMKCTLDTAWHCGVGDVQCHRDRPYRLTYHFIELSTDVSTPHTIVRVDHSHLPTGNKRMSLLPKYALNTLTHKPINTDWLFQIDPSQTEGSVDIRLIGTLDFPAELLLELNLEVYHSHLFIGKSTAMIYLYVTKYPDDYAKDDQ